METIQGVRVYDVPENVAFAEDVTTHKGKPIADTQRAIENLVAAGFKVNTETLRGNPKGQELVRRLNEDNIHVVVPRTSIKISPDVMAQTGISAVAAACVEPVFDTEAAAMLGVIGFNAQENSDQVVELTYGQILGFAAGTVRGTIDTQFGGSNGRGQFRKKEVGEGNFAMCDVRLGVMGAGVIGRKVMQMAKHWGVTDIAFCNDRSPRMRDYDKSIDEFAVTNGFLRVNTPEELFRRSNLVSIHVGSRNHAGVLNTGIIDETLFNIFCERQPGQEDEFRIVLNNARIAPMGASPAFIAGLLKSGALTGFACDVFDIDMEQTPETFVNPYAGLGADTITTPHIGGSNTRFVGRAALGAARKTTHWAKTGSHHNSLSTPHDGVDITLDDGQFALEVCRSLEKDSAAKISAIIGKHGLNYIGGGRPTTGEHIPGTHLKRGFARHVFAYENAADGSEGRLNGEYSRIVKDVVGELCELRGVVRSIRPIPTNNDQREQLRGIRYAPNLNQV